MHGDSGGRWHAGQAPPGIDGKFGKVIVRWIQAPCSIQVPVSHKPSHQDRDSSPQVLEALSDATAYQHSKALGSLQSSHSNLLFNMATVSSLMVIALAFCRSRCAILASRRWR